MRELESMLQQFGEFLLKARLVKDNAAPHCVGWVRRFLTAPTTEGALADRARRFCEELERCRVADCQVRQAEHAIRIYFVNFLKRTDWLETPRAAADQHGQVGCALIRPIVSTTAPGAVTR